MRDILSQYFLQKFNAHVRLQSECGSIEVLHRANELGRLGRWQQQRRHLPQTAPASSLAWIQALLADAGINVADDKGQIQEDKCTHKKGLWSLD